ncbi:MAG TPA: helix-turn-helix transcriptional regulator [Solirubrobacteraceae bacterium]|nr:helix-turn-helix transcriptional regulator [Solirubrobacteraceae bacterium]
MNAALLLKDARRRAGLTQAELARKLGVTQAAISKLEDPRTNPTINTLDKALRATGRRLAMETVLYRPSVDESLIRQQLKRTPNERFRGIEAMYSEAQHFIRAGRVSRGEQP